MEVFTLFSFVSVSIAEEKIRNQVENYINLAYAREFIFDTKTKKK